MHLKHTDQGGFFVVKNHQMEIHIFFALGGIIHSSHALRNSSISNALHSYFHSSDPQFELSKISYVQHDFYIIH